ncbi:uncharacterized protein A1O9_09367 [Exophiala aquamarina CBS 119918]|uniref:RNase III domain-containing protein n=1 Tax=Exophiala aquamarina CBS 119918 TaxID=1182545 RepID=A0A072P4A3_9EURO|nr:uncharacterized protein A1O9_09367 [Exophiala aquamarina CBS 119918]KEF54924.1 hypothetical protein A1O9_09367 [Exophiala aquamarina CBS 119918]
MEVEPEPSPRWSHTPPAMKAPFSARLKSDNVRPLKINSDPRKLDQVYVSFLGQDGDKLLSDETKWLAVTAKSYDHGRRKRILELQCSLGLLSVSNTSSQFFKNDPHGLGRIPYSNPATDGVEVLAGGARNWFAHHKNISKIAIQYGFHEVVRWVPRLPDNLESSGSDLVYSQALLAVIGALALEQGSAVANRAAKERILIPMGLRVNMDKKVDQIRET